MVRKKVGTITLALGLIAVGVLLFAQNFIQLPVKDLYKYWPVLLIGLGLEMIIFMVIYGREGSNVKLGVDGLCIFFIIVLGLYASGASFIGWKNPGQIFSGIHIDNFMTDGIRYHGVLNEAYSKDNVSASYNIKEVKINNEYGDVKVVPSNTKSIKVEAQISVKYNDEQKVRQYMKNAVVIKEGETTEIRPMEINESDKKDFSKARIDFTIYVPDNANVAVDEKFGDVDVANINANLTVDSKNGEVNAENIGGSADIQSAFGNSQIRNIKGDVKLTNKNGNSDISDVTGFATIDSSFGNLNIDKVDKDLKVTGRNGEIEISKITGKTEVENSFGNIRLNGINGEMIVNGKNGNIDIDDSIGNIKVDNSYGNINCNSGNANDANIYAHTSYGEIFSGKNLPITKTAAQAELKGTTGSGKWKIELTTRNGNVNID